MEKALIYLTLALSVYGCDLERSDSSLLDRMCGEWEFTGTEIREEWKKTGDLHYHIDVISYAGWEPELTQTIDIQVKEGSTWYEGKILRQHNSTRPIKFKATEVTEESILFENQAQEFPQHIRYSLIHQDKIRVKISGSQGGKYREQEFTYYRYGSEHSSN